MIRFLLPYLDPQILYSLNIFQADSIQNHQTINLTPLSYVPGARIEKYLGNLNFFLIRETSSLREVGGISSFVQSFICEIYSIVRSHVNALGGNAVVSYFMSEFVVMHSVHKNQVNRSFISNCQYLILKIFFIFHRR